MKLNSPYVITINRQLGSGGAYVGQKLAQNMNILYADNEIIKEAAKQFSLLAEDLEYQEEKISSFWKSYFKSFAFSFPEIYASSPVVTLTDLELFAAETKIIKHIANERSAVIIGRCGCNILEEHPNRVSIYLHSEDGFRIERIMNLKNISEEDAEKMIIQSDKERSLYYNTFTGKKWADARQYDLSIDTSKIGLDKSVELIMKYLE